MRLAYCSPLPPLPTGVAEYARQLLPQLGRRHEVELFTEPGQRFREQVAENAPFPVRALADFEARQRAAPFDAVIYQLGNDQRFHGGIYEAAFRHPGVVVLHEVMLHHMVQAQALARGGPEAYVEEMRYAYGASGRRARRFMSQGVPPDLWRFPLFERVVDASRGVLVHNEVARRRVLASRPAARVGMAPLILNMGPQDRPPEEAVAAVRRRLGLAPDALLVGTFGHLTASKRIAVLVRAFRRLLGRHPSAHLLLAGQMGGEYDQGQLLALAGEHADSVTFTGRLGAGEFLEWMAAVDVAVNLRHPTGGESSGTLLQLFTLERPVIVTDAGAFAELPEGTCARMAADGWEEETLTALLDRLLGDEALRRALGRHGRHHVETHHSAAAVASAYEDFLAQVAHAVPEPPVPPLAPWGPEDAFSALVAEVSAAMGDLGIEELEAAEEEGEGDFSRAVAEVLVDLDLDGAGVVRF